MIEIVASILIVGFWVLVLAAVEWLFPCECRKSRFPYYLSSHENRWAMLGKAALYTLISVLLTWGALGEQMDLGGSVILVTNLLLTFYFWRGWYLHEKDRLKKLKDKIVGKVVVKDNGRLGIEPV